MSVIETAQPVASARAGLGFDDALRSQFALNSAVQRVLGSARPPSISYEPLAGLSNVLAEDIGHGAGTFADRGFLRDWFNRNPVAEDHVRKWRGRKAPVQPYCLGVDLIFTAERIAATQIIRGRTRRWSRLKYHSSDAWPLE